MATQPGQQTIVIHVLTNISRRKGNQTMKLGELIEYYKRNIMQKMIKGRLVPDFFLFYKKV